jgi:hypothetical protein
MCTGCCDYQPNETTGPAYSTIFENMGDLFRSGFDVNHHPITQDPIILTEARWAEKAVEIMLEWELEIHQFDDSPANMVLIRDIFDRSLRVMIREYEGLHPYLFTTELQQTMREKMCLNVVPVRH